MSFGANIDFNNCQIGRPVVVGIFGVSGSGKTFVLDALKHAHGTDYILAEGSEVISRLVDGGLQAFQAFDEAHKKSVRELAIQTVLADCLNDRKIGVVSGHFMFWSNEQDAGTSVWTQQDLETYTHIIYLNTPPETIHHRCLHDTAKRRPELSIDQLRRWQNEEERQLRSICYGRGVIYSTVGEESVRAKTTALLDVFLHQRQESHRREVESQLDDFIGSSTNTLASVVVLDTDKTLSAADSGPFVLEICVPQESGSNTTRLFERHLWRTTGLYECRVPSSSVAI